MQCKEFIVVWHVVTCSVTCSMTCNMTGNEWKVMWMHCDKCNAVYELQEKEYDKGDAINAIQLMQCN